MLNSQNLDCIILERKKGLNKKPPFYIFDLTRKCYISSLKPTDKEDLFNFDVRLKNEENLFFTLQIFDNGKIEVVQI